MKIGYLVPEFPGQTDIFFWRERQALQEFNIDTCFVSTTHPPQGIVSHTWSEVAQRETTYLFPPSLQDAITVMITILQAGPKGWWRCLRAIWQAEELSIKQKARQVALIAIAAKLVRLSQEQGWSHIHVHSCATSADIAMFAALLADLTYSLTQHGPTFDTYGPNQAQKWHYAAFGILVSDVLLQEAQQRIGRSLPERVSVMPMGVDLDQLTRQHPYQPWQKTEPCRIFSVGRLNPVKAHNDLMRAVKLLVERGFDVRLQIAGEDDRGGSGYRKTLEQLIQENHLGDRVELLGAVSEPRIREGLEQAHVFALASLNEGTSVAIMEAMAMAMPVVVTAVGGTPKLVQDGINGVLVEPQDPVAMADQIEALLLNPEFAMKLGGAARQTIAEDYHHRRGAKVLAKFLNETAQLPDDTARLPQMVTACPSSSLG